MSNDQIPPPLKASPSLLGTPPDIPLTKEEMAEWNRINSEHRHLAAVGHVASAWAHFEWVIDDWSMRAAGIDVEVGTCFTSQVAGAARKLDAFISVVRLRGASDVLVKELLKFAQATFDLQERRNRIIHDPWFTDVANEHKRLEATARKKLRLEFIAVSTDEVIDVSMRIHKWLIKFHELATRICTSLPELPDKEKPTAPL